MKRPYIVEQSFTVDKKPFENSEPARSFKAGEVVKLDDIEAQQIVNEHPRCLRIAAYCDKCGHYW